MKTIQFLAIFLVSILINACAPLKAPTVVKNDRIEGYQYIVISPTGDLTSTTGGVYGTDNIIYGSTTSNSVNPSVLITGILSKEGLIRLPELKPHLSDQTLIVNYGESGSRRRGMGYTTEVTIQFVSANSHRLICSCTAEGQQGSQAGNVRQAITRCLSGLLSNEN